MKSKFRKLPNIITFTRMVMSVIFTYLIFAQSSLEKEGFIFLKFLEFTLTSNFIKGQNKTSTNPFVFDKVGRLTAGSFFVIPGVACALNYLMPYIGRDLIKSLLYITLVGGVYSSFLRIKNCFIILDLNISKLID